MTEADEIAGAMAETYGAWLKYSHVNNSMDAARKFVQADSILAQESMQIIDNVAWSLYQGAK